MQEQFCPWVKSPLVSDVCNVGEDKVLLLNAFVKEVLNGSVQVSIIVGINDFLFELRY